MEIAKRDELIQQHKDEIERQKNELHVRFNHLKGVPNPKLRGVKEEYKKHFQYMDQEVNKHTRELNLILAYIGRMLKEDRLNMDMLQEEKNILRIQNEFKNLKLSLNKILS